MLVISNQWNFQFHSFLIMHGILVNGMKIISIGIMQNGRENNLVNHTRLKLEIFYEPIHNMQHEKNLNCWTIKPIVFSITMKLMQLFNPGRNCWKKQKAYRENYQLLNVMHFF